MIGDLGSKDPCATLPPCLSIPGKMDQNTPMRCACRGCENILRNPVTGEGDHQFVQVKTRHSPEKDSVDVWICVWCRLRELDQYCTEISMENSYLRRKMYYIRETARAAEVKRWNHPAPHVDSSGWKNSEEHVVYERVD